MKHNQLREISELLDAGKIEEAKKIFESVAVNDSSEYWLLKGKIEQKFQNWGAALNAYLKVQELDEENEEAKNSIQVIQNILNFWNPEMFNP
jgi:tetratricopeptide (TPR) repeat protein